MARKRKGPHKTCRSPSCRGGGTYDPAIKNCKICNAPFDKKEYEKWVLTKGRFIMNRTCTCGTVISDDTIAICPTCGVLLPPVIITTAAPVVTPAPAPVVTPVVTPAPAPVVTPVVTPAPAPVARTPIDDSRFWSIFRIALGCLGLVLIVSLLVWFLVFMFNRFNPVNVALGGNTKETIGQTATFVPEASAAVPAATSVTTDPALAESAAAPEASNTTPASIDAFKPKVTKGETISANKEFQVKAGDVVSGDVYYVTADDVAVPIMDDDSTTALVVYFTQGARLRTGDNWSVYLIHQPTEEEIANVVTEKQKENFERVDLISFPQTQKQSTK